jgi:hypothetical protein
MQPIGKPAKPDPKSDKARPCRDREPEIRPGIREHNSGSLFDGRWCGRQFRLLARRQYDRRWCWSSCCRRRCRRGLGRRLGLARCRCSGNLRGRRRDSPGYCRRRGWGCRCRDPSQGGEPKEQASEPRENTAATTTASPSTTGGRGRRGEFHHAKLKRQRLTGDSGACHLHMLSPCIVHSSVPTWTILSVLFSTIPRNLYDPPHRKVNLRFRAAVLHQPFVCSSERHTLIPSK